MLNHGGNPFQIMNAYIVAGYRSAVGKAPKGGFRFTRPDDLAAAVIKHTLAQLPQLDPARVDDLIVDRKSVV